MGHNGGPTGRAILLNGKIHIDLNHCSEEMNAMIGTLCVICETPHQETSRKDCWFLDAA
jgi:hypothetical protein